MDKELKNDELKRIEGSFLMIGTSEIGSWTKGQPFVVSMETLEDFILNGFDEYEYADLQNMKVGEMRKDFDYEGIYVIRVK